MISVKLEVSNLINPTIKIYKELEAEFKNLLDYGLMDYLESQTEKYYHTYTFLHRGQKVKFFDIYYKIKASHNKLKTDFNNPKVIFEDYKYIVLMGSAGSGKSTLARYIFLNSLKERYKIPILIELRHLSNQIRDKGIHEYFLEKILNNNLKSSDKLTERSLLAGHFIFILDGYDEIISSKLNKIEIDIKDFIDRYPKNNFLITSRPGISFQTFPRFHIFSVISLSKNDIFSFIKKLVEDEERKKRLLKLIEDGKGAEYFEYLRNPLILSMFILAFEKHPEIPKKRSSFYANVFDTLYSQHDGITKGSFNRERKSSLFKEDFEKILKIFSFISYLKGSYSFTRQKLEEYLQLVKKVNPSLEFRNEEIIYDLEISISIIIKDGFEYKFPHRSLQEYFAVLFISTLNSNRQKQAFDKIYRKALYSQNSSEPSLIWVLLMEMDHIGFKRHILIPRLEFFLAIEKKGVDQISSLLEILKIRIDYNDEGDFHISVIVNENWYLLNRLIDIQKSFWRSFTDDEINKLEENEVFGYEFGLGQAIEEDEKIKEIVFNSNFVNTAKAIFSKLKATLSNYEKDIKENETGIDFLFEKT